MNTLANIWDVSPKEAVKLQNKLRLEVIEQALNKKVSLIAGADVSFNLYEKDVYAGIIVLSFPDLTPIEYSCIKMKVDFPYIPGLLSFREIPPLLKSWGKIKNIPTVIMVDGHGIAHPRRLGIAAHLGLTIKVPTFGCAKNILYGQYTEPGLDKGDSTFLIDPKNKEIIGSVVRTKDNVKPVIISAGYHILLKEAQELTLTTARGYRLPEPTRQAHLLVNKFRTGELPMNENHKIF